MPPKSLLRLSINFQNIKNDLKRCVNVFVCVCVFVCLSALDLSNGGTYEYQIWTANSCDDTDEDEVLIFYVY